jgi:hypothetical protein
MTIEYWPLIKVVRIHTNAFGINFVGLAATPLL